MIDGQNQYRKQLARITKMKIPKTIKIQMMYSLNQLLKQSILIKQNTKSSVRNHYSISATQNRMFYKYVENQSTKFSLQQSMSIDTMAIINQRDIEELEQNILHKKIFKIQNYQEIEALQQELYQIQDVIESKRRQNDYMRKKIDQKMLDIQVQKEKQDQKNKSNKKSIFSTPQRSKSQNKQTPKSLNKSFSEYIKSFWW